MKTSLATRIFLVISGITVIGIGGALLFAPAAFQASVGINLGDNVNLLSETRAPGGALFAAGMLIISGAFTQRIVHTALVISSLIYLSYAVSRILSMVVDGIPHNTLVAATGYEIVIGLVSLFLLLRLHTERSRA